MIFSFLRRLFGRSAPEETVELRTENGRVLKIPWSDYEATLKKRVAAHPGDATIMRGVAKVFVDWRKYDRALPLLDDLVMRADSTDEDRLLRARTLACLGRAEDAESVLRRLTGDSPSYVPALVALAGLLHGAGKRNEARDVAHAAIDIDPDAVDPLEVLHDIESSSSKESAVRALREVASAHPGSCGAFIVLGRHAEAADPELAAKLFEEGLARNPKHEPLLACVAVNLLGRGKPDEVIARFDSLVSDGYLMEFLLYASVAEAHFARGNTARVLGIYNERIQRGPEMHRQMARERVGDLKERLARKARPVNTPPASEKR